LGDDFSKCVTIARNNGELCSSYEAREIDVIFDRETAKGGENPEFSKRLNAALAAATERFRQGDQPRVSANMQPSCGS